MGGLIDDEMLGEFAVVAPLDELPAAYARWVGGLADRTSFTPPEGMDADATRELIALDQGERRRAGTRAPTRGRSRVTASGPPVVVTREGNVALITLDRPKCATRSTSRWPRRSARR